MCVFFTWREDSFENLRRIWGLESERERRITGEVGREGFTLVLTVLNLSEFPPLHSPNPVSRPLALNTWLCERVNEQEVPCWRVSFVYFQFTCVIQGTVSITRGYCVLLCLLITVQIGTMAFINSHLLSVYHHNCLTFLNVILMFLLLLYG